VRRPPPTSRQTELHRGRRHAPHRKFARAKIGGHVRRYICLGKRALFLIDFEPPFQEQFYYAWVERVIIDTDNLLLFQIDFTENRAPLILESFERDRLCDELAICWKADSMFRNWRWMPFPKKRGLCQVARRDRTATEVRTRRAALAPARCARAAHRAAIAPPPCCALRRARVRARAEATQVGARASVGDASHLAPRVSCGAVHRGARQDEAV
jgi:hypothetical protein